MALAGVVESRRWLRARPAAPAQCSAFFFTWWCLICYVSFRQLSGCVRGLDRLVGLGRRAGEDTLPSLYALA